MDLDQPQFQPESDAVDLLPTTASAHSSAVIEVPLHWFTGGVSRTEEPQPINWNLLHADEAEAEWLDLNAWVDWLRRTYGLPPTVVPPLWHRHDELVWELSALHVHWLSCYDPDGSPSGPIAWHRDFADARLRLREWVSTSGTRLDRDRATRRTSWPGEPPSRPAPESEIEDRAADFVRFVLDDVASRREAEAAVQAAD